MLNWNEKLTRTIASLIFAGLVISGCVAYEETVALSGQEKPVILHGAPALADPVIVLRPSDAAADPLIVRIDAEEYRFPMAVYELTQRGWRLDSRFAGEWAQPGVYIEGVLFRKDGRTLRCIVGNPHADRTIPLSSGMAGGIEWDSSLAEAIQVGFSGLIGPDMKLSEAEQILGPPLLRDADGTTSFQAESVQWQLSGEDDVITGIKAISRSGRLSQIPSGRIVLKSPSWGEDPTTGRILIDGEFFKLPATLEQFEASGWVKGRALEVLLPNSESVVRMDKGEFRLTLGVVNETDQILELRDCPVISVRPASPQTGLPIQLTHTLKTAMPSSEAIGFAVPYKPRIKQMDELIFYEVIRNHMTIRLVIDTVQEVLVSIEYEWHKDFAEPDPVNRLVPG